MRKKITTVFLSICMMLSLFVPTSIHAEEYSVNVTNLAVTPYIREAKTSTGNKELRNDVEVTINNKEEPFNGWAKIYVGDKDAYVIQLEKQIASGNTTLTIPVTDTNEMLAPLETTTLQIEIYDNESCQKENLRSRYVDEEWQRTRHWEFYLSQSMHTDLGYTEYQEDLKKSYSRYLDTVKEYMKNSDDREDVLRYKYAIESGFVMGEGFMENRNVDEIQEILDLMEEGRMNVGAGRFNYTMENFSAEETAKAAYYTNRYLVDKLGIKPSTTQRMFDNPSFSKSYVDIAASAGIKYGLHSMNDDRSPYEKKRLYDIYYMQGNNPENKMLIFNGKRYSDNYGFGGTHFHHEGSPEMAEKELFKLINRLESRPKERTKAGSDEGTPYPYDKFPLQLVPFGDNQPPMEEQVINANGLNKKWKDEGLVYPRVKTALPDQFFEELEEEYGDIIPIETGTEENWWNDGWGTTAYESGINKEAGSMLPNAETATSLAALLSDEKYSYEDLYEAAERNLIYDEHTWGYRSYDNSKEYHKQFEWKRSNGLGAKILAETLYDKALDILSKQVATEGKAIFVYNPLNWTRNDKVSVSETKDFPENYKIMDGENEVKYTKEKGVITFVASDVPAHGYKTFTIVETRGKNEKKASKTIVEGNVVENDFYKVTFANDGTIASIIDKKNDNREIVDGEADGGLNQYQYYDDFGVNFANGISANSPGQKIAKDSSVWEKHTPKESSCVLNIKENATGVTAYLDTSTFRANSIKQKVILYDDIAKIDIENEIVREPLPTLQNKEEAFYVFPFKASNNYKISYDQPLGNVEEGSQIYGTSTDWYTANKWVNVKDGDYNITLAIPNSSLVQFGERRTGEWSFDYKSEKPHIYSYIMNNMWQTNFQGDQPGSATFKYSITTSVDKTVENTARFGWEVSNPLQAKVIAGQQEGSRELTGSYFNIDKDNVQMTTMKTSESNGEGMIVRLHEITGKETKVTVTLPGDIKSINETDIIENDLEGTSKLGNTYTLTIPAYGMKTLRVKYNRTMDQANNVSAIRPFKAKVNHSKSATIKADSEYNASYRAVNASTIDGKDWATHETTDGTLTMIWNNPVTAKLLAIKDRKGPKDFIDIVQLDFKLNGNSVHTESVTEFTDDELKTILLSESVTFDELIVKVNGSMNVGLDGIELYENESVEESQINGTKITWDQVDDAWYYEVYRSNEPGKAGRYIGSSDDTVFFDKQVDNEVKGDYYYSVKSVGEGVKSTLTTPVKAEFGNVTDTTSPLKPLLQTKTRRNNQIDLTWTPVKDDTLIAYYEVYRDGELIGKTEDSYLCTYRDKTVVKNTDYTYYVNAVDIAGNKTQSNTFAATTKIENDINLKDICFSSGALSPKFEGDVKNYDLYLGDHFNRLNPIEVTVVKENETDKVTINGNEVQTNVPFVIESLTKEEVISIKVEGERGVKIYNVTALDKDPIINVDSVKVSTEYSSGMGMKLVNNDGMSGKYSLKDTHGNANNSGMWHTYTGDCAPWVSFDLGSIYALDEMYVWNMNQITATNVDLTGRGFKNVKIEYSENGTTWNELSVPEGMSFEDSNEEYPFQFTQADGSKTMSATNLNDGNRSPVQFNGIAARYVKITAAPKVGDGSWGTDGYYGLSEVRFTTPVSLKEKVVPTEINVFVVDEKEPKIELEAGQLQMEAVILPETATETEIVWSVTDIEGNPTEIATISKDGLLTARHNGTVKVVATSTASDISGECTITISGQSKVIDAVNAISGESYHEKIGPDNLTNHNGMSGVDSVADVHDNHSSAYTMWHTKANPGEKAWVEFDLGEIKTVGDMWIWNMNQRLFTDRGLRNVKIEYRNSETEDWQTLENVYQRIDAVEGYPFLLAKASGEENQKATNLTNGEPVVFNRAVRYVRITAHPEKGVGSYEAEYFGLSEVRFTEIKDADQMLLDIVTKATAKEEKYYTADSWKVFEEALTNANKTLNTAFATDKEVEEAANALTDAMNALETKPDVVDKSALKDLIDSAKKYEESNYTVDSWKVFEEALTNAETVLIDENATQEEVVNTYNELEEAIKQLTEKPVDKSKLQELYDKYSKVDKENYTDESWKVFEEALTNAETVLADKNANQETIDAAEKVLKDAYEALTEKATDPDVDKSGLESLYDEYSKLNKDDYTENSWDNFENALEYAKSILGKENATQEEIDYASDLLKDTVNRLIKNNPTDPENPNNGGNTDNGDTNNGGEGTDTGDTSNLVGMAGLMLLAGTVIVSRKEEKLVNKTKY